MSKKELNKEHMYEGVKALVESQAKHIHLPQQKLYTLYSIAFNYLLFLSSKEPGHYIIRIQDSFLMDKIIKKAKDDTSRKFLNKMSLPRRFKYERSMFHIDFFNFTTWANTNELPKDKIKGALIVKSATKGPVDHEFNEDEEVQTAINALPKDFYLTSLQEFVPKTITIAFDEEFESVEKVNFPFILDDISEKLVKGVSISEDLNLDDIDY